MSTELDRPDPGATLADLMGLAPRAARGMSEIEEAFVGRYGGPSELQSAVQAELGRAGSCLVVAPPASGKTEAAIMPLAEMQRRAGGLILYVCPTRALINDIVARLEPGFVAIGRTVVARHGESKRSASAYSQASCVVITPESLQALVVNHDELLARVRYIVLDELHSLDRTARGAQLQILLSKLAAAGGPTPVTVGLTATVSDPEALGASWGGPGRPLAVVEQPQAERGAIVQVFHGGVEGMRSWLRTGGAPAKVLAFANSRRRCDEIFIALKGGIPHVPLIHYSDLERADRLATESLLRTLPSAMCIATSTLELGIDIGDIDAVILADPPWSTRNLRQRIGRGGRRTGQPATAVFPESDRDLLRTIAAVDTPVYEDDDGVSPVFPSVLVQQTFAEILADSRGRIGPVALEESLALLGHPRSWGGRILSHMRDLDVLIPAGAGRKYELNPTAEKLLGSDVWGNFPADAGGWEMRASGRRLAIVQLAVQPAAGLGILFIGKRWRVTSVQRRMLSVVQDESLTHIEAPIYRDSAPLISWRLADGVRRLLAGTTLPINVTLDGPTTARLDALRERCRATVDDANLLAAGEHGPRLLTFAGSRVNSLLAAQIPDAAGADELGITLQRDLSPRALRQAVSRLGRAKLAEFAVARLAEQTASNRWLRYLPADLQREEITSQFLGPQVLSRLAAVSERPLIAAPEIRL